MVTIGKKIHFVLFNSHRHPRQGIVDLLPEHDVKAAPITRLTPFFHDIRIESVTATGSDLAGVIIGLPESPVKDLVVRNVSISAQKASASHLPKSSSTASL